MDALEAILTRIRRYTAEPVAEDLIKKLLEAAMYAFGLSAALGVYRHSGPAGLDKIPEFPLFINAQVRTLAILVCGDSRRFKSPISGRRTVLQQPRIFSWLPERGIGYSVDGV